MQTDTKNRRKDLALTTALLCSLALAVTHIEGMAEGVRDAISLCARAIVPTLFPFLVLSDLLLSLRGTRRLLSILVRPLLRPLRLSDYGGSAFLLGALFGFPLGAKVTARYYREGCISREEAERLLLFSGNASPFFLIGSVGTSMLSSPRAGVFLYLLQLFVSFFCGFLLARFAPKQAKDMPKAETSREEQGFSFSRTVQSAVRQSLYISGYILLFSAVSALLLPFFEGTPFPRLLVSLLEIGNASALSAAYRDAYSLPFCAFATSFSGLSVYFQTLDVLENTHLSTRRYLPVKLLSGAAAFFLALLFPSFG